MIYPFRCDCGNYSEAVRPSTEADLPEVCSRCGQVMVRVWTPPMVSITQSGYYDHGLGMHVKNRETAQRILQRNSDVVPVEVGNERSAMSKIKPQMKDYSIPRGALDGMD